MRYRCSWTGGRADVEDVEEAHWEDTIPIADSGEGVLHLERDYLDVEERGHLDVEEDMSSIDDLIEEKLCPERGCLDVEVGHDRANSETSAQTRTQHRR